MNKTLTDATIDEVLGRLGFVDRPALDQDGLAAVYQAWCRRIPFDNLRKLVALHYDMPELPGIDPADFFAAWLLTGAGGTCWSSNSALHALLSGLGFDAVMRAAAMWDITDFNHGTTMVTVDGTEWLVDTAVLSDRPVPLVGGRPAQVVHRGYVVRAQPDPDGWLLRFPSADPEVQVPCRLHHPIDHETSRAANERTREVSPFNDVVTCHTNDADGVWLLRGRTVVRIDETGSTSRELTDAEVDEFLVEEIGYVAPLVAEVRGVLSARS